jgi:hypothetical protein
MTNKTRFLRAIAIAEIELNEYTRNVKFLNYEDCYITGSIVSFMIGRAYTNKKKEVFKRCAYDDIRVYSKNPLKFISTFGTEYVHDHVLPTLFKFEKITFTNFLDVLFSQSIFTMYHCGYIPRDKK